MINRCIPSLIYSKIGIGLGHTNIISSKRSRPRKGELQVFSPKVLFGRWTFKLKAMFGPPLDTVFDIDKKGQFSLSSLASEDLSKDLFVFVSIAADGFIYRFGHILSSSTHQVKGFIKLNLDGEKVFISKPKKTFESAFNARADILFAEKCKKSV